MPGWTRSDESSLFAIVVIKRLYSNIIVKKSLLQIKSVLLDSNNVIVIYSRAVLMVVLGSLHRLGINEIELDMNDRLTL